MLPLPLIDEPQRSPSNDLSASERARIESDLKALDVGEVRFDRHNRLLYSTDASLYQVEPIGVVVPAEVGQAKKVVAYCAKRGIALLPRGGGTSLAGQCTNRALVLDLSAFCLRVISLDAERRICLVEPGISIDELNRHLAAAGSGLFFAPDPATTAQAAIGGCIGNNAAGARSIRYGRTSENLAGVELLLSSGEHLWLEAGAGRRNPAAKELAERVMEVVRGCAAEIRARFPKLIRRNAGYGLDLILSQMDAGADSEDLDLSGLICGSEGTLGVITGAKLKLMPVPKARGLAIASFTSVEAAIAAVPAILNTRPSAVELLDDALLAAARGNVGCRPYVDLLPQIGGHDPAAALYVEYQAEAELAELDAGFAALSRTIPGVATTVYRDGASMFQAWSLRKSGEALLHGLSATRKPVTFVEDNAIPVDQLSRFVSEFRQIVARHGTIAAYYAHASVGVLHVRPMLDLHDAQDLENMRSIAVEVADLARVCGGVMSGEHGDGRARGPLLERFFGAEIIEAFRQIKQIFDPAGILNPGMIVDAGPVGSIAESLRVQNEKRVPAVDQIQTFFNYSDQEGFHGAVEMCNGAGFCRKTAGGTMCPSYRATLDERHSTRGRGNALRLAITGQALAHESTAPVWNDPGTIETLDLCLSCKACKSECPSNVDIARLKAEYTAQRYREQGEAPLQAKVFGQIRRLNQLGSLAPGLANAIGRWGPVRAMMNHALGLAPQRSLPPFARSLYSWFNRRDVPPATGKPRVVLFADCFTTYNEPEIGRSAVAVLEALGYAVELPKVGCCGRAMISTGLLAEAIRSIDSTLADVRPFIEDDTVRAVLVCEPSCLSAMKDDWLQLKVKTDAGLRKALAGKAMLVEEFVDRDWDRHPSPPRMTSCSSAGGPPVLLHGHCHQKALWGDGTSADAVRRLVGDRLQVIPSGCCGMAGSFGYTASHYDVSMKIGELSLFQPVRQSPEDAIILAPGTSCRHQIRDGTGKEAIHPIELVARLLVADDR